MWELAGPEGVEQRLLENATHFSIGASRGLSRMTECLADLTGKETQMWDGLVATVLSEDASDGWRLLDAVIVFR